MLNFIVVAMYALAKYLFCRRTEVYIFIFLWRNQRMNSYLLHSTISRDVSYFGRYDVLF